MEWVETTGKTVAEATEAAVEQLGVAEEDAEIEILDEPKSGLFGRMRSEARVRARVRPQSARPKDMRRRKRTDDSAAVAPESAPVEGATQRRSPGRAASSRTARPTAPVTADSQDETGGAGAAASAGIAGSGEGEFRGSAPRPRGIVGSSDPAVAEAVLAEVRRLVEGFLDAIDVEATIEVAALPEAGADVSISGEKLGFLIGPKAVTLLAVQDLLRTVAFRKFGHDLGRINLDISGYRERRRQALTEFTRGVAAEVVAQRQSRALEPMNASDRKVVHDTINDMEGISSRSEGEDPYRRVVLIPA